jgi:hypothetical protein
MKAGWEVDEDNFYKEEWEGKRKNQMNVKNTCFL